MEALENPEECVWKLHFYTWFDFAEYRIELYPGEVLVYDDEEQELVHKHNLTPEQIKWRRYKIGETSRADFLQEYPNDPLTCFLTSGGGVFTLAPENLWINPTPTPQADAIYVAALDWGQVDDYTALSIMEVRVGQPTREVLLTRWRKMSWGAIRANVVDLLRQWHVEKIVPERNSASSNIEDLKNDIDDAGLETAVQPFTMSNPSKDRIVKLMQRALEEEGLQLLDVDYANHEMRTYQTKQTPTGLWSYSHPDGGHDDTVDARMLANFAANQLWI